jgi:hypothetical protein
VQKKTIIIANFKAEKSELVRFHCNYKNLWKGEREIPPPDSFFGLQCI